MLVEWWESIRVFSSWNETRAVIQSVRTWAPPRLRIRPYEGKNKFIKNFTIKYASIGGLVHQRTVWFSTSVPSSQLWNKVTIFGISPILWWLNLEAVS
jgi:hypothetical protein